MGCRNLQILMTKTTQSPSLLSTLDDLLNQKHSLYKLSHKINWHMFEKAFTPLYYCDNSHPAKPVRLIDDLLIINYLYNISDESVVE